MQQNNNSYMKGEIYINCLKNSAKFFDAFQRDDQENFLQGFPYRIKHQN